MRNEILKLIEDFPKHYSKMIKNNAELNEWVENNCDKSVITFPEKVYTAIYKNTVTCNNGNKKRFVSINNGYSFCGKANKCVCCKQSVSNSVSLSKQHSTEEQKKVTNKKREVTNLEKYGVVNAAQTQYAKSKHAEFYSIIENVNNAVIKVENTKQEKYGDKSFNNREKAKETFKQKYGYENPVHLKQMNQNQNLNILRNKEMLEQLYNTQTVEQISQNLQVHQQTVYRYLNMHQLRDPYTSTFEKEIANYLNALGITNIVANTRKLIPKEIDIYLPEYNLAIEFNGVYWHHDQIPHIDKHYHYTKFKDCENKGIDLFTIFSDSWATKKEIWKKKIKQKLGLSTEKVYARKCIMKEIDPKDTRTILDNNHVQGYCPSQIAFGLYDESELVAVMTFSNKRAGIGKDRGSNSYELVRYVTSKTVVGGAGKLLNAFKKKYNPALVYSYSDNRYSSGSLYKTLGFDLEKENKCGYWYYDPSSKKSYHRFKFTKFRLVEMGFDSTLTEYEIMKNLGYMRIWDCGTRTWILTSSAETIVKTKEKSI
jgi:G:T-mismatch repair DNA endonuclease (very short patch repair protein)